MNPDSIKKINLLGQSIYFDSLKSGLEANGYPVSRIDDVSQSDAQLIIAGDDFESREIETSTPVVTVGEAVYRFSKDKQRIIITGSQGSRLILSLVIHVLSFYKRKFDYFFKEPWEQVPEPLKISMAPMILVQGLDRPVQAGSMPDFRTFNHHIGVINSINWHSDLNISEDRYLSEFEEFADATPKGGSLIYSSENALASVVGGKERTDVYRFPYEAPEFQSNGQTSTINLNDKTYDLPLNNEDDMSCVGAATTLLKRFGIDESHSYEALATFPAK